MRWYKITCGDQTWDATGDPNALNVELNLPVSPVNTPNSAAFVRVWGIPLSLILSANKYNSKQVQVFGGMQQGLPLANPAQQGLLVQGTAFPVLGNWIGTDQTFDIYIKSPMGLPSPSRNANLIHQVQKNQPLSQAIKTTLQNAFPGFTPIIRISQNLKLPYVDTGFYQTITQYATFINDLSRSIMNSSTYHGVQIVPNGNNIIVHDYTQPVQGGQIAFTDLIGQPVWTGPNTIQFKTVMRGDLVIGQTVTLPKAIATLTENSGTNVGSSASNIIQGNFQLQKILHTGNFRQPDWSSWASTFDAIQSS